MAQVAEKAPAYVSYKTLMAFLDAIRESAHVPLRIERSLMPKLSGSASNEALSAMKFLGLINDKAEPTELFEEFVFASDEDRAQRLDVLLRRSYGFVFEAPGFDLSRATQQTLAELFRPRGVSGSTLSRSVAFFLSAAKAAGIKVSPHAKAPPVIRNGSRKSASQKRIALVEDEAPEQVDDEESVPPGSEVIEVAIPINRKVRIILPDEWDESDWEVFKATLDIYIAAWKKKAEQMAIQKLV